MQSPMVVRLELRHTISKYRNPVLILLSFSINESGGGGAEPEVDKCSGACQKHFRTLQQAEAFIADWEETYACVVKAKIKDELSNGHVPGQMQGGPVHLSLIRPYCDGGNELVHT